MLDADAARAWQDKDKRRHARLEREAAGRLISSARLIASMLAVSTTPEHREVATMLRRDADQCELTFTVVRRAQGGEDGDGEAADDGAGDGD